MDLPGLPDRTGEDRPQDARVSGETFRGKPLAIAPLDLRVVAGSEGITQTANGFTVGGSWDEVVGVAVADGIRELVLVTDQTLRLSRRHLRDTSRLFAIVDERISDRRFDSTEDEILTG